MTTVIVTRHNEAKEWIVKHTNLLHEDNNPLNPLAEIKIISHASPEDVRGNMVIGVLPEELSSLAKEYWKLNMNIPAELRGKELTCEEMEACNCSLKRWIIIDPSQRNCPMQQQGLYSPECGLW